jgi:hypothetical protein
MSNIYDTSEFRKKMEHKHFPFSLRQRVSRFESAASGYETGYNKNNSSSTGEKDQTMLLIISPNNIQHRIIVHLDNDFYMLTLPHHPLKHYIQ